MEKLKIKAYRNTGLSTKEIVRKTFGSHPVIGRIRKNSDNDSRIGKRGNISKQTVRDKR